MTFFFKQKTAYEIMPSLVGSEMCIRDRLNGDDVSGISIIKLEKKLDAGPIPVSYTHLTLPTKA